LDLTSAFWGLISHFPTLECFWFEKKKKKKNMKYEKNETKTPGLHSLHSEREKPYKN
jgi:hypothetical protein